MNKIKLNDLLHNKIFKTGSLSLLATVLVRAVNLISVPIFSRLLSTAEYGQVDVFMTYVNIFMVILGLDFQGTVGKGRLDHEEDADKYMTSSLLFTTISASVIVAIINIAFPIFETMFSLPRWAVNIMFIYSYAMFVMAYKSTEYNFYFEYKKNMKMSVTVAVCNLILSIIFIQTLFKTNHFLGRILGATVPTVICAVILYIHFGRRGQWAFEKRHIKYAWDFGVPLIPHNLSHMVLASADKVMINSMISASASGIYSLAYTLGMMIQVASEAMNQVFSPWQFRKLQSGQEKIIQETQRWYLLAYCMIAIAVLAVSPEILKVIGAKEYWEGTTMIMWVVFAMFLNFVYTLYVNIEFFYKKTALISLGTILAAVINVVLNAMFLKTMGYQFGAISTVFAYGALLVFHAIIVNVVMKKHIVDNVFVFMMVVLVYAETFILNTFSAKVVPRLLLALIFEGIFVIIGYGIMKKYGKLQMDEII